MLRSKGRRRKRKEEGRLFYLSLKIAYQETIEDLASFIAVADVFERFGCVLPSNVEENFFTASVGNSDISGVCS